MALITAIKVSNVTGTTAIVTWLTDLICTTSLDLFVQGSDGYTYTRVAGYPQTLSETDRKSHIFNIGGLTAGAAYKAVPSSYDNVNAAQATYTLSLDNYDFNTLSGSIYHTPADVTAELLQLGFTASTDLKPADVQDFCNRIEAQVNTRLSLRYYLPITFSASPNAYYAVKDICVRMTVDKVRGLLKKNAAADDNRTEPVDGKNSNSQKKLTPAEADLEAIIRDEKPLFDAARKTPIGDTISGSSVVATPANTPGGYNAITLGQSSGAANLNPADSEGRVFQQGTKQW